MTASDTASAKKRGLGRGLSALLGEEEDLLTPEVEAGEGRGGVLTAPVSSLHPNPHQPRRKFDDESLADLASSLQTQGVLTPIVVRKNPDGGDGYQIVAGERRWRAAQLARLHELPIIVRDLSDRQVLEVGLVENLQRQDLSPIEEADGYRRLMEEFSHTQEALAQAVGKSRSHVANMLRLTGLPQEVKDLVEAGLLSAGHARALITADDPVGMAHQVVRQGLNVRQTERLVQQGQPSAASRDRSRSDRSGRGEKDADTLALERDVSNALGLDVAIDNKDRGGTVTITYENLAQLDDILRRLSHTGRPGE
ncbi:ParB/RepB/Spo0J family partition protein [Phaeovibrio sulfidiphilus]|uniref:ParB/RepB/Spo0J family partition protein n=1 Tax=Phaeovibrio sulfidiphilus TaxID=1220600 RepID=A0A8J7CVQ7_9PROT|nr:ParB/RepB/Spo0J family partition protein [Phaeovibrio sulfidiphilus]MBE1236586.1 ParB/RepB/Spo0J family partition protein [Phaeovibrio sulfidiphilus]